MRITVLLIVVLALGALLVGVWLILDSHEDPPELAGIKTASRNAETPPVVERAEPEGEDHSRESVITRTEALNRKILDGACVSGTATDQLTGEPVPLYHAIELWEFDAPSLSMSEIKLERVYVDKKGAFAVPLANLPLRDDRRYCLVFDHTDYVTRAFEGLITASERRRTGLDVRLEPKGCLEITCQSFQKDDLSDLSVALRCRSRLQKEVFWIKRSPESFWPVPTPEFDGMISRRLSSFTRGSTRAQPGPNQQILDLEAGMWTLTASLGNQRLEKALTIDMGRTTRFTILRDEIAPPFEVKGTMRYSNGSPVIGAQLIFTAIEIPDLESPIPSFYESSSQKKRRTNTRCVTDENGEFTPLDLLAGTWRLTAFLEDGSDPYFPDIVIPPNPDSPRPLDLVVQRGTVSGVLCDRATQLPFGFDYTRWFIVIRNCGTGLIIADHGNRFGSSFTVDSVPPGSHQLEVCARGMVDYVSPPFAIAAGQDLDLGEIGISRQDKFGSLLLTFTDGSGSPIEESVQIEVLKPLGVEDRWNIIPEGRNGYVLERLGADKYHFDRLPAERLTFRIKRDRIVLRKLEIAIEPELETTKTLSLDPG